MTWFRSVFADYENMADAGRTGDQFLDDSYEALSPYDGSTGVGRIEWENRRKDEYRNWLKKVRHRWEWGGGEGRGVGSQRAMPRDYYCSVMLKFESNKRGDGPETPTETATRPSGSRPLPYGTR